MVDHSLLLHNYTRYLRNELSICGILVLNYLIEIKHEGKEMCVYVSYLLYWKPSAILFLMYELF